MKNLLKDCCQPKPVFSISDMLPFASVQGIFSLKMQYLGIVPPLEAYMSSAPCTGVYDYTHETQGPVGEADQNQIITPRRVCHKC